MKQPNQRTINKSICCINNIDIKESFRYPKPSFITSTFQQDAVSYLNMSSSRVMMVAQSLI
jgi:DNA topoisomerase IA